MTLDESSFANYFAWIKPTNKIENPIEDLLSVIDVLEDDEASAEQLEATTRIIKKYENPEFLEIELESCKLKDSEKEKLLLEYVKKTLREIEGVLQAKGLNDFYKLCDMSSKFKYFKLRVFNEFKRTSFSALMENPEKNGIDVYLKNFFETHGNKSFQTTVWLTLFFKLLKTGRSRLKGRPSTLSRESGRILPWITSRWNRMTKTHYSVLSQSYSSSILLKNVKPITSYLLANLHMI